MKTASVKIAASRKAMLEVFAAIEKKDVSVLLEEMVDEYMQRHQETMEILSNPEWAELIGKGKKEILKKVKGRSLDELPD
ncbi:MAG: hypothetical protein PHW04_16195 [Candidatus Wallbacteria bacterium]|nr:hypothetical protein [Candidatus Wallbacteria bacterium]